MKPNEERLRGHAAALSRLEPGEQTVHGFAGATLDASGISRLKLPRVEVVVVSVEPSAETPRAVEHEGAHKRRGGIALALERLGDQPDIRRHSGTRKVAHSIRN